MSAYRRETERIRARALKHAAECGPGSFGEAAANLTLAICDLRDALGPYQRRVIAILDRLERWWARLPWRGRMQ